VTIGACASSDGGFTFHDRGGPGFLAMIDPKTGFIEED
jgi:hypothetical protein